MKKIFGTKQDLYFLLIGIGLSLIALIIFIYGASSAVGTLNRAFNPNLIKAQEVVTFNLNALEKVKPILEKIGRQ